MSSKGEVLYHSENGSQEQTWTGFSFPAFFFGIIWLVVKGVWTHACVAFLIVMITAGAAGPFVWLYYGFRGNEIYKNFLIKKGYLTKLQYNSQKTQAHSQSLMSCAPHQSSIDALAQLALLKASGALNEEEFATQKKKLGFTTE